MSLLPESPGGGGTKDPGTASERGRRGQRPTYGKPGSIIKVFLVRFPRERRVDHGVRHLRETGGKK